MAELHRIRFNNVGELPVPCDWMLKPDIKVMPLRYHKSKKTGSVYVLDQKDNKTRTAYSFRFNGNSESLKRGVWQNWNAVGLCDCEFGYAWISANYEDWDDPDFEGVSSRVTWFVRFSHDGQPERYTGDPYGEFWGWIIEDVSVMHAYDRVPRSKTPITYRYQCKNLAGEKVNFEMTGNGEFDSEQKAKKKIDEDPNLRKAILADVDGWQSDHYYDRRTLVEREEAIA